MTVHYPDDGLGIGAIRMGAESGANLYNNIIGKASGGRETIRYSAGEKVQLYNSIKNLSTLAGHCEADGDERSAGLTAASAWYAI